MLIGRNIMFRLMSTTISKISLASSLSFVIAIVLLHLLRKSDLCLNNSLGAIPNAPRSGDVENNETEDNNPWRNAPRFSLILRLWHGAVSEYWKIFAPSYLIFWPYRKWLNSDLILVFDDESYADHQSALTLSLLPPYPKIKFEKPPPEGTLCNKWRSVGYVRQMYSDFFFDEYTDAPFIAIVDTDMWFQTKVMPEDLFENGKPRMVGHNGCCTGFEVGSSFVSGGRKPGEFMVNVAMPFIIRREHLKLFREHIVKTFNMSFEKAYSFLCNRFAGNYSQFDMLAYYVFYYHRDDYSWHITTYKDPGMWFMKKGLLTEDPDVLKLDVPKIVLMKMTHESDGIMPVLRDFACVQDNFTTPGCEKEPLERRRAITDSIHHNWMTHQFSPPALWDERGLPVFISMIPDIRETGPSDDQAAALLRDRHTALQKYKGSWHW